MRISTVTGNIGRGLAAGVVGTAAMTASSSIEAKLRGRGASTTPAAAAGTVLGVEPASEQGEQRFNTVAHWGYGTAWGGVRGLIASTGMGPVAATATHLGMVWGAEQVVLPATGASSPASEWPAREVGVDLLHHAVYVAATGLAFGWLFRH